MTIDDPYGFQLRGERADKILVINCGSSSLKFCFYDAADVAREVRGQIERIGIAGTKLTCTGPCGTIEKEINGGGYDGAFEAMIEALGGPEHGAQKAAADVTMVVHRVVHGGENFSDAVLLTPEVLDELEKLSPLAPLHNPANLAGIRKMQQLFATAPQVAVFDTAFHHTLPEHAYLYGLPYELYEQKRIRRYGFHGTSHQYVSLRAAQFLGRRPDELRVVSCHLGNGSSLCAVDRGRSVDTSMGFTPGEGLIMGTRCGDVDSGILSFLQRTEGYTAAQCEELLNKKSGLLGLSGVSSDMREVLKAAEEGNSRALIAVKSYCYRVRKYLGAYVATMGGLDTVIFTGGVGQGSAEVRALALQGLDCMGIVLDQPRNRTADGFNEVSRISQDASPVEVLIVPTDEERMMAREAMRKINQSNVGPAALSEQSPAIPSS